MTQETEHATRTLPAGYANIGRLDLLNNSRILIGMNILGLVLFLFFAWFFTWLAGCLQPVAARQLWQVSIQGWNGLLSLIAFLLGVSMAVVVLHEAAHGLFFWLFTGSMPHFEFKIVYAAASAPGWYLPRLQYMAVGLAPFVLLSLAGSVLMPFASLPWLRALTAFLILNASGAVGDLIVVIWVLVKRHARFALDETTSVTLFAPLPE